MPKVKATKTKTAKKPVKAVKAAKTPRTGKETKIAAAKASRKLEAFEVPAPSVEKQEVIAQFQVSQGDTGSPEVQIALLTKRIEKLVGHLKTNPSDNHSRRGLLGIVSKRRRLLNYLEKKDGKRFKLIAQKLGLGK